MKIAVVGTGYVGLVAGTCLADSGHDVICVDKDAAKVEALNRGEIPIYEPQLAELVKRNTARGRLHFSTDLAAAAKRCRVAYICVGTPPDEDGHADLGAVFAVARAIGEALEEWTVVVLKSTVPVGTADKVRAILSEATSVPCEVVSNPEFLKEGAAVDDFTKPDRVVVGTASDRAAAVMQEIYAPFVRTGRPIMVMDNRSAEFVKYAANCMLATKISFINEMANLAERVGADIAMVRRGIGTDSRIGYDFLFPGAGYGGSCFPKDVDALIMTGREHGYALRIMESVREVNEAQKSVLFEKLDARFESLEGRKIAVWGLAFKPRTDDMREAPAITLIEKLLAAGASVSAYDPEARDNARELFGDRVELCDDSFDCLPGASALVVVTEWNEFRRPDFHEVLRRLAEPVLVDGRNLYDPATMAELGLEYYGIGVGLSVRSED